jgi:hypothetical protein
MTKGQTVFFTTSFDNNERSGVIQEVTSMGYQINNVWYAKKDVNVKNILLDSKTSTHDQQLILG